MLLNDVGDNPDQLPLLQHALMRTWEAWKTRQEPESAIDIIDYTTTGTISDALSIHAEEAYDELAGLAEKKMCETILQRTYPKGRIVEWYQEAAINQRTVCYHRGH
jgi:hypothetical protein